MFFKSSWQIVGEEVTEAIVDFFESSKMLRQINNTLLTLIPKVKLPRKVSEFRPIACCNVIYKGISKVLCERLSSILPKIVSHNQSAFIQGRNIVENVLICHDLVRKYMRRTASPRCLMKLDLKKAYDSVRWSFIEEMLQALEFPSKFIRWIMLCVTTPSYTIAINGETHGFFKGERGLRQGDPLSPLLFTLCREYLTRILNRVANSTAFQFHPQCKTVRINHLCFADDLMLFCKGDQVSIMLMLRAFQTFSEASGLEINRDKSSIYFCGMKEELQHLIRRDTGFKVGKLPFKYLGVPVSHKRLTFMDCQVLIDKITTRIHSWGSRNLSYMGRVQLVQSVLLNLHSYWARIFLIPKNVLRKVEAVCINYLWEGKVDFIRSPLVAWDFICRDRKEGGLGFPDCVKMNEALIGMYVWWIAKKEDSLWVKWVHHVYIKQRDWWQYSPPVDCAWTWKKICHVKNKLAAGFNNTIWKEDCHGYTSASGYSWLTGTLRRCWWSPLVWNRYNIPKHCFISWLIMLKKLKLKGKLMEWGVVLDDTCMLCGDDKEIHEHLFFNCTYSTKCVKIVEQVLDINMQNTIDWKWIYGKRAQTKFQKLVRWSMFCGCAYTIYMARNKAWVERLVPIPSIHTTLMLQNVICRIESV